MPRRPKLVPVAEAEEALSYARCRSLRHAWDPIGGVAGKRRPAFGDLVTLRCVFCGTLRFDKVSRLTGQRISPPQYDHPEGYKAAGKHDAAWWRATWLDTLDPALFKDADE